MSAIRNRYDFVYLFDVKDGNPNGDPDAGNLPRLDPETHQGLVSDVCLKRKVRNYVDLVKGGESGYRIYVAERAILEHRQGEAWEAVLGPSTKTSTQRRAKLPKDEEKARALTRWMCANFYDVRTFGAVMSTSGANCGQVRGPVQLTFARSVEPVLPLEVAITRMAVTTEADAESKGGMRTMGRKYIVPYGLYRAHGYVSAPLAAGDGGKGTGFCEADLELLWGGAGADVRPRPLRDTRRDGAATARRVQAREPAWECTRPPALRAREREARRRRRNRRSAQSRGPRAGAGARVRRLRGARGLGRSAERRRRRGSDLIRAHGGASQ